jgi:hypothetical protein
LLLLSGSAVLDKSLIENSTLPFGNLTTAIGFIAIPLAIMNRVIANKKFPRNIRKIYIAFLILSAVMALFWWFFGRILSGNWSNNFYNSPEASKLFWNYTYGIVILPISILLLYLAHMVYLRINSKK